MDLRKPLDFILCKTFFRVKFEGRENVDFSKRYVFVANHVSAIDAMVIYTDIKDLGIMAKAELFKFKLFGKILSSQGVFPIERGKKDFGHVFNAVKIIKKHNKNLLIFPEGTRKAREKGVKAKNGAVYIAAAADVQIVPMHITEKIGLFKKLFFCIRFNKAALTLFSHIPEDAIPFVQDLYYKNKTSELQEEKKKLNNHMTIQKKRTNVRFLY